ncbi:MAG: YceI family protein [Sinobacteraceae bacterium]|nr:YceI family protein [Nevskiaceae bacterium]
MYRAIVRLGLGLALVLLAAVATAADYAVQYPQSRLGFTATFQGVAFEGHFERWQAAIRYDPADLAQSRFDVEVDTASAKTGDADRDNALPGADFFDAAHYPRAHYVTTGFRRVGNQVIADGTLTLRGISRPVSLTVTFVPDGKTATLDVAGTLKRLDFGVGGGEYADTSVIGNEVQVKAHLALLAR